MTPDKLTALAARLRDHASDYITHPDDACKHSDLLAAAEYLRQCAQADAIEALRMALDALSCTGEPDDPGHRCGHCDDYVDRNAVVRARIRAVLAAQGGNDAK